MRPLLQEFKADFFRALAHPIRIRILETLGSGEHSVHELQQQLALEQPVVSQQLANEAEEHWALFDLPDH